MESDKASGKAPGQASEKASGWRAYRREITFLVVFLLLLGASFTAISLNSVNDSVIEPFTAWVAKVSGKTLKVIDSDITMTGTVIRNETFAVNIKNGCNGVETMLIFCSAVLAFPAPWRSKVGGLFLGLIAIQVVNIIRVVALFLTGVHFPKFFDTSHTVVWQSVVILFGVLLWIFWADRFSGDRRPKAGGPAAS